MPKQQVGENFTNVAALAIKDGEDVGVQTHFFEHFIAEKIALIALVFIIEQHPFTVIVITVELSPHLSVPQRDFISEKSGVRQNGRPACIISEVVVTTAVPYLVIRVIRGVCR